MKIYTYYNDIYFDHQDKILALWKESWKRKGFDPIILHEEDAKKHPYFDEFSEQLIKIYEKIKGEKPDIYVLCCYYRWLAYATLKEDKFFVSDYDVINFNFDPIEPVNNLHFMTGICPCFASGQPKLFEEFTRDIIRVSNKDLDRIKKECNIKYYHDQEFIRLNLKFMLNKYKFSISDDLLLLRKENLKIKHYAHPIAYDIKKQGIEEIRLWLIENDLEILKMKNEK